MRIAVSSAFWDNPSGDSLEPWLERVSGMGYDGVTLFTEYWKWGDTVADGQRLASALAECRLGLASIVTGVHVDFDRYRQLCNVVNTIGCEHLVLIGGTGRESADRQALAIVLNRIGRIALERSVAVSYHHHTDTAGESFAQVEELLSLTDPDAVTLAFDSGHAALDFVDLPHEQRVLVALRRLWKRIGMVELKDLDREGRLDTPLGDGTVDAASLLGELASRRYDDWLVIEQNDELSRPVGERDSCAKRSLGFLRTRLDPARAVTP